MDPITMIVAALAVGAAVAWWTANTHPERLHKLAILNVPHPNTMKRVLRSNFAQLRKSWYIFFFQLPWLPEALIRAGDWRGAKQALLASSRPGTFSEADLAEYVTAWSQPGAFTAMINWYRAMFRAKIKPLPSKRITVPTLLIWGAQDFALGREMAQAQHRPLRRRAAGLHRRGGALGPARGAGPGE